MEITFLTHAALMIKTHQGTKFVCDPWILDEPVFNFTTWKFPAPVVPVEEIVKDVDWLLITHSHEDHFHVPSLDRFDRATQIILPEYESHPHLRAHTVERTLRMLGFEKIYKVLPWQTFQLDSSATVTIIPSADSRPHDWENCGFVVEDSGSRMLNMNDNVSDLKLCKQIKDRWNEIDIAFIQSLGVTMWPGRFKLSQDELDIAVAAKQLTYDEQRRMVDVIRPKAVVPFAGDFCWMADQYLHQNWCNRGTPQLFYEFMEHHAENQACETLMMLPSDNWSLEKGWIRNHPPIDWGQYLEDIDRLAGKRKPKVDKIGAWIKDSNTNDLRERTYKRLEVVKRNICNDYLDAEGCVQYAIQGNEPFEFFIWLADGEFGFSFEKAPMAYFQTLHLQDYEMAAIVEGKLTWNIVQWVALAEQHFLPEGVGKFWYWLEYHVDLNTKNCQVYLEDKILPEGVPAININRGVFD